MKVSDVVLRTKDPELQDFVDNVQVLLNSGRYEFRVINTIPNWAANEGESVLYWDGANKRSMYVYMGAQWFSLGFATNGGTYGSYIINYEQDTAVFTEFIAGEKILRFYANSVYALQITSTYMAVSSNYPIVFNGTIADTYWIYNSSTDYLECWVDGLKRMEM